jgi:hypothetical protein
MEARRKTETDSEFDPFKAGWFLGSEEFRQELLAQVDACADSGHSGAEIRESAESKANHIIQEELRCLGWTSAHLETRRKGDAHKIRIAVRLRRESTMTLAWIARRLYMGAPSHLACLLYRNGKKEQKSENTLI